MKDKFLIISIIISFIIINIKAQDNNFLQGLSVKPFIHYGFIANHHPEMAYFTDRHIAPFEISVLKRTDGSKVWQQLYKYPEVGISLFTTSFSSSDILGNVVAAYPFIVFSNHNKSNGFNFRIGTGLGYFSEKFSRYDNYKNLAISTHINATINFRTEYFIKVSDASDISVGVGLTHFSNGAFKTPNLGLNIITASTAISLYPYGRIKIKDTVLRLEKSKNAAFSYWLAVGEKEVYPVYGKKFKTFTLSTDVMLKTSQINRLGLGLDFFYDESDKKYLIDHEISFKNDIEIMKIGASIINEFQFSKISFLQYMGLYGYSKNTSSGLLYQRLALRYYFYKGAFACISLKTHWGKADFTEFAVGYRL